MTTIMQEIKWVSCSIITSLVLVPGVAAAQSLLPHEETDTENASGEIIVYGRALPQLGIARSGSQGAVGYRDFEDKPVSRVAELVENVPGMIATQHSGTGKANQYFLRGFNLDHGTDFAGFVDGVPINMRSHGHGQGYLDLNFLIPELVERIDYRKGPYFSDVGDFSAAGTALFKTVDRLAAPIAEVSVGSFGYYRALVAGSGSLGGGDLLAAFDATASNGPWALDEDLRKYNGAAKFTAEDGANRFSIGLTGYRATWNATDQVPLRAIEGGGLDRFGNIDPDLGGSVTRIALTANGEFGSTKLTAYGIHYNFGLTSNFTYFLEDPVSGDEFQQGDRRQVYGATIAHDFAGSLHGMPLQVTAGADMRYDDVGRIGLYRSVAAERTATVREDGLSEFSVALFTDAQLHFTERLRGTVGLRVDHFRYDVKAGFAANSGKGNDAIVTPKLALAWRPTGALELYGNYGESYHSNDVRGAAITVDPVSGDPVDPAPVLVRARGGELGGRIERERFSASAVVYYLNLGSELVFVGDGGSTEPNDASRRSGTEFNLFWRPLDWLAIDSSAAFTRARFHGVAEGEDRIPGSVERVVSVGITADFDGGLSSSLRLRHFGSAPLIEDDSQRSEPTTLVNAGIYYRAGKLRLGAEIFNLFDSRDADITYFYASRLAGEPAEGVEDYHFHPVEPRQLRISARLEL